MRPLPPTALALLRALHAAGGALPYRDARVTTSGLTALRRRGLATVDAPGRGVEARVVFTPDGTVEAARIVAEAAPHIYCTCDAPQRCSPDAHGFLLPGPCAGGCHRCGKEIVEAARVAAEEVQS